VIAAVMVAQPQTSWTRIVAWLHEMSVLGQMKEFLAVRSSITTLFCWTCDL
jgi:hypothetical protein